MKRGRQPAIIVARNFVHNDERGMTLVEVLVALAILAAVAGVFLTAISTTSKAVMVGQEHVNAESLAKSQMESIQQQNYHEDLQYDKITQIPTTYAIDINVVLLDPRMDQQGDDQDLQKIIITVTHLGKTVFTLEGYKCNIGQ